MDQAVIIFDEKVPTAPSYSNNKFAYAIFHKLPSYPHGRGENQR
jgi:hypothetical protein